jgi:L-arabinose isomerase
MAMQTKPTVGLLVLSLGLYESLAPAIFENRRQWIENRVLPALALVANVRLPRIVYRREDIEQTVREFESTGVEGIMVICASYSPSQLSLPALLDTSLPILIWNTQELATVDHGFCDSQMTANHGAHGTQDLANVLVRADRRFDYMTSHLDDPNTVGALADWFAAAATVTRMRRLRLGLLGYAFPGMGDLAVDTTHMTATLGCRWLPLGLEEYIDRAEAASGSDVAELVKTYRDTYDVAADVTDLDLEITARAELSLRGLVVDQGLGGFSFQFMALGEDRRTVTVPFVGASRLMADGVGFAGEGDLVGAAGTWLLNQLREPATFSEVFTIDFAGNSLLMSHMGEANVAMAPEGRKVRLVARPQPITRTRGRQLALVTTLRPGPATLAALTLGPAGRWRIVASRVRVLDFGDLREMAVPHFKIAAEHGDIRDWLTQYALCGGPHHNAICFDDCLPRVRAAARLLGADFFEIS